jgi:hypothetical protein
MLQYVTVHGDMIRVEGLGGEDPPKEVCVCLVGDIIVTYLDLYWSLGWWRGSSGKSACLADVLESQICSSTPRAKGCGPEDTEVVSIVHFYVDWGVEKAN